MKTLKVTHSGDKVQQVVLCGDRRNPEPEHFRIVLPFGDVDIVRCTDDSYWVHIRVNRPEDGDSLDRKMGFVMDGRLDIHGKHVSDVLGAPLDDPNLYHAAIRIGPAPQES